MKMERSASLPVRRRTNPPRRTCDLADPQPRWSRYFDE